jgi:hypothetical protein
MFSYELCRPAAARDGVYINVTSVSPPPMVADAWRVPLRGFLHLRTAVAQYLLQTNLRSPTACVTTGAHTIVEGGGSSRAVTRLHTMILRFYDTVVSLCAEIATSHVSHPRAPVN